MNKLHVDTFLDNFGTWYQIPCVYCGNCTIRLIESIWTEIWTGRYQCTNCHKQWFYNSWKVHE